MRIRPIHPLALFKQLTDAHRMTARDALVLFRDAEGNEHQVSKVKIRGRDTIIICEREDWDA